MRNTAFSHIIGKSASDMSIEAWLSLVERCVRDAEAASSNLVASTISATVCCIEKPAHSIWTGLFLSFYSSAGAVSAEVSSFSAGASSALASSEVSSSFFSPGFATVSDRSSKRIVIISSSLGFSIAEILLA